MDLVGWARIKGDDMMKENKKKILDVLKKDARTKLTDISKQTGIPVSTVYDIMLKIKKDHEFILIEKKRDDVGLFFVCKLCSNGRSPLNQFPCNECIRNPKRKDYWSEKK